MRFKEEFEYEISGSVYCVSVSGQLVGYESIVDDVIITDHLGEQLEESHKHYDEIHSFAVEKEYDIEIHTADFDYYGEDDTQEIIKGIRSAQ